ncbi:hypothetical protein BLOT_015543 [Blomia tropicalis]|nr:hypothetical protein BLOT_015543 [Blomia tropicalis]
MPKSFSFSPLSSSSSLSQCLWTPDHFQFTSFGWETGNGSFTQENNKMHWFIKQEKDEKK